MGHILLENAVNGRRGKENHILTEIVLPLLAVLAVPAGLSGLKSHPIPHLQMRHAASHLNHGSACLMAQHKGRLHNKVSDPSRFIVVKIRAADSHVLHLYENLPFLRNRLFPLLNPYLSDVCHHRCFHSCTS